MDKKIVPLRGTRKRKQPEPPKKLPLPEVDFVALEQYSMTRMSARHMALMLGITDEQFEDLKEHDQKFRDTIELGRAKACHTCAQVLLKAAQGRLGKPIYQTNDQGDKTIVGYEFGEAEKEQVRSSRDFLERHGPNWLKD